jgi:hypothetical protein
LPPTLPNVAHFETGRTSRLVLPNGICPNWFQNGQEVIFAPLYWCGEFNIAEHRRFDSFLIFTSTENTDPTGWLVNPFELAEESQDNLFTYNSKLNYNKQQWRVNCPPLIKAICDEQKRVLVTSHPQGICIWSRQAFSEYFG